VLKYQFDSLTDELGKIYAGIATEDAENEIKEVLKKAKKN